MPDWRRSELSGGDAAAIASMLYHTEVDSACLPRGRRARRANGMEDIVQIPVPLPHIRSVNTWLLRGDPLTLVDTGPRADEALAALEAGLRARRRAGRGHRARPGHAPPPRPHGPGRDDRRALGRRGRRARSRGRLRRALRRALRGRPALLARADAPPRRAGAGDRRQRGVLGLHPRDVGRLRHRRRAARRRAHPRRRARPARRGAAGPQHHRRAVRRRARAASRSSATTCWPGSRPTRRSTRPLEPDGTRPRARVEYLRQPAADGRDAARPAADRPRRRRHRARRARRASASADHERRCERIVEALERRPRHRVRDRPAPVVAAHGRRAAAARRLGGARAPRPAARRRARRASRSPTTARARLAPARCPRPSPATHRRDRSATSNHEPQEVAAMHEPADTAHRRR